MLGESFFLSTLEKMLMTEAESESSKSYLENVQSRNPGKENFEKEVIDQKKKKIAISQTLTVLRTEAYLNLVNKH